jgi:hypothetical protein
MPPSEEEEARHRRITMAKPSTTHVIEIESGIGEPAFIPLTLGQELQPISIGKKGMWRVDGARVMDVHAFVYFDGASLFLQSADESAAAVVDGYRIGKAWTELHAPCKIDVGGARLRYRSLLPNAEGQATQAAARPPVAAAPSGAANVSQPPRPAAGAPPPQAAGAQPMSFPKPERPFKPGEFSHGGQEDESTRFAPLDATSGGSRTGASVPTGGRPPDDDISTRPEAARYANPPGQPLPANASGPYPQMTPGAPPVGQPMPMQPGMQPVQPMGAPPMAGMPPSMPPTPQGAYPQGAYPQQQGAYPQGSYPQGAYPPPAGASGPYPAAPTPQGSLPPGGYGSMTQGQAATPEPQGLDKFIAQYKEMSVPKRILVVLLPLAMGLTVWSLWDDDEPPPRPRKVVAHADAGASPSASVAMGTQPTAPTAPTTPPVTTLPAWPANVPCPPPGWPPNQPLPCVPNNVAPPPVDPPKSTSGKDATKPDKDPKDTKDTKDAGAPLPPGAKTLERQAVDAVAAGDYVRAAGVYEELSRRDPTNRVYAEAARILRNRLDGGAP